MTAENRCPQCGDEPTYQTPDGTFWDGNAHFWRVPEEGMAPVEGKVSDWAKVIAFQVVTKNADCYEDDYPLDGLLNDIGRALDYAREFGAQGTSPPTPPVTEILKVALTVLSAARKEEDTKGLTIDMDIAIDGIRDVLGIEQTEKPRNN